MSSPDAAVAETTISTAAPPARRLFGLTSDVGLPDGINIGLVVRPTSWIRAHGVAGTNTASVGFRGGITAIPYWLWHFGPSATFEAGFCRLGDFNDALRTFFQVPSWMNGYVQQAGYTYYNAHFGLEFGRGNLTGYLHFGGSYLDVRVRTPHPVAIPPVTGASSTNDPAQVILRQDAKVTVYTLSGKAGIIVYFGGL
jgi:hypothetical protein